MMPEWGLTYAHNEVVTPSDLYIAGRYHVLHEMQISV